MLCEQMLELGLKSSVIREIFEYARVRKEEIGDRNVFDFSLGNPSIPTPAEVTETMRMLLRTEDPVTLHGYTSAAGDLAVRRAVAEEITARFGIEADPGLIYMTCGAAAALTVTLKAICNAGDEVVLLAPFFPEYRVFAENAGARTVVLAPGCGMRPDFDALAAAITPRTRAVIVNSPNNPSGVVLNREDIKRLAAVLCEKRDRFGTEITVIADEPYRELVYDGVEVPYIPCFYDDTVVCYSYSKSLSIPGERIGYVAVSPRAPQPRELFAAVCGAGRSMGFVCAPALLQKTVAACVDVRPDLTAYDANRRLLYTGLTEMGYEAVRPDGAFYLFVKALEEDAAAFCERAKKYELLLVPGDDFGVAGYVRIAYCVDYDRIERSLPAFLRLYQDYQKEKTV